MQEQLKILMVEDQPLDAELLQHELRRGGYTFTAQRVDTRDAFKQALADFTPDIILSDFSMPSFDGLSALQIARDLAPETPFIFVSGTIGEDRALEALRNGATDYVLKDRPKRLITAIGRALDDVKKRTALVESRQALRVSEETFRSFMQHLPARASIQAMDGHYTFVNQKWELGDGPSAGEAPPGDSGLDEFRQRVATTNKPLSRVYHTGKEGKWWFSTHFPIPDPSGAVGMIGTVDIDITEQKTQEEKLSYLQYYDALTGLPNATLLQERLDKQLQSPRGERTALIALNINRFDNINDSLGHDAGDQLLRELASRLRSNWPEPDKLARLGEDRFAGMLTSGENGADVAPALQGLLKKALALPFKIGGNELTVSLSAGISLAASDGTDAGSLLRNAQTALKQAKMQATDCAYYQSAMNRVVTEALMMENKLRRAIQNEHFDLHYQPKVNLASGAIVGVEALLRWNDPDLGFVPPIRFIPLLEETGLIVDVGAWVVRRAAADYRAWLHDGLKPPRIAVNVSALQLAQKDFLEVMSKATGNMKGDAHGLDMEITESLLMSDVGGNIAKLHAMQEAGFKISVDDFGTGYSSLAYLTKLPVNTLKIDRSFIATMTAEADNMAIVSAIISLAHSLGLTVVAEGVETEEQKRMLKLLRCEELQGYVMFRPMPRQQLKELLAAPGAVAA